MTVQRDVNGLNTVLKIAREHARALREDLRDIERARLAAGGALAQVENDECDHTSSNELGSRRSRLSATLVTLERAEADARARLESLSGETGKLERLIQSAMRPQSTYPLGARDVFRAAEG